MPAGATVATSSTRRKAQFSTYRPDLKIVDIRGNVVTRMQKLAERAELDATILAAAGLARLNFTIAPNGKLKGDAVPDGLLATVLEPEIMLPASARARSASKTRAEDERIAAICERLNHFNTRQCVHRRARLSRRDGRRLPKPRRRLRRSHRRATSPARRLLRDGAVRRAEAKRPDQGSAELGQQVAAELK